MDASHPHQHLPLPPDLRPGMRSRESLDKACDLAEPGWVLVPRTPQWPQTRLQEWMEGGAAPGVTPTHPELGDLSWKDHWVTGVGVCRRVGLPLSTGSQGPVGQLRACSQLWAPGTPVASPSQAPVIPKLRGVWVGQLLPSVRCPGSSRGGQGAISSLALPGPATPHLPLSDGSSSLSLSKGVWVHGLAQSRA